MSVLYFGMLWKCKVIFVLISCSTLQLYLETADPHVNVIIVDFSSTDIDVVAALKQSQLKR